MAEGRIDRALLRARAAHTTCPSPATVRTSSAAPEPLWIQKIPGFLVLGAIPDASAIAGSAARRGKLP